MIKLIRCKRCFSSSEWIWQTKNKLHPLHLSFLPLAGLGEGGAQLCKTSRFIPNATWIRHSCFDKNTFYQNLICQHLNKSAALWIVNGSLIIKGSIGEIEKNMKPTLEREIRMIDKWCNASIFIGSRYYTWGPIYGPGIWMPVTDWKTLCSLKGLLPPLRGSDPP